MPLHPCLHVVLIIHKVTSPTCSGVAVPASLMRVRQFPAPLFVLVMSATGCVIAVWAQIIGEPDLPFGANLDRIPQPRIFSQPCGDAALRHGFQVERVLRPRRQHTTVNKVTIHRSGEGPVYAGAQNCEQWPIWAIVFLSFSKITTHGACPFLFRRLDKIYPVTNKMHDSD